MKTKQVIGIIVAALAFVFVCASSVFTKYFTSMMGADTGQSTISYLDSLFMEDEITLPDSNFVGIVRVEGTIQASQETSLFGGTSGYNHTATLDYIDQMMDSDTNQGILLFVNSPGGTVYEADELYLKLEEYKEKTNRPILAYFGSEACSGGYYAAMAADEIYANRNCWTGSIGVIISLMNYKELFDKWGIKETDITSGANKAMGSSAADLTEEQRGILQGLVDEAYGQFVGIVADGRGMSEDDVKILADGRIYSAQQAVENGLVDKTASYEEAKDEMKELAGGYVDFYEPSEKQSGLLSSLSSAYEGLVKKSDAQVILEEMESKGNGVLMYYAETGK